MSFSTYMASEVLFFFFNDTATTEIYTLSLHDALPIKACFRRVRPDDDHPPEGPLPYGMHRPISSSFPSGHAASAFTAAMLLAGGPATPMWFALAATVAASRVYTQMHHASDVVA